MIEDNYIKSTEDFSKKLNLNIIKKIHIFNHIDSTNKKAKELAQNNSKEGTIVISKVQKKGRGRFDRNWESPEGGLYFSIILKPKITTEKTTLLPLLGALSVYKTIKEITDLNVKIKWPNDVMINGKKACGILLESESDKDQLKYIILGIGINLNNDISSLSKELHSVSTTISNEIGIKLNYYDFFEKLLINIEKYYKLFIQDKHDVLISEWKQNSDTIGRKITINASNEEIIGTAVDIDEFGFLLIKTDNNEIKRITTGDCIYIN